MNKNLEITNKLISLLGQNTSKENIDFCKQIIIQKNDLLIENDLENINNLLSKIIFDKNIILMIQTNCDLIYADGKVDINDLQYIIKLALCLVDLFNNQINFNIK